MGAMLCFLVPSFRRGTRCAVHNVTTNSVILSWPGVKGATNYTYNYGFGDINVNKTTSVCVSGLRPATTHSFHVTVHGSSGTGNALQCSGKTGKVKCQMSNVNLYSALTSKPLMR